MVRPKALNGSDLADPADGAAPERKASAGRRLDSPRRFYDYARANPGGRGQVFDGRLPGSGLS